MSTFKFGVAVIVLATALSTAAYAAQKGARGMLAAVRMLAVVAIPLAAACVSAAVARVTSAPDRRYPVRVHGLARASTELRRCTPRTMPSVKGRRPIQPGTQRATRGT